MRTKQSLSIILVFALILGIFTVPVFASNEFIDLTENEQQTRFSYVNSVDDSFYIYNGTGYVKVKYFGIDNLTTRAEISIKLQHQFLFWWFDVSGGEWFDTVYGVNGEVNHSLALSSGGNFRAVINVKVYGQGTGYDEINDNPTASN